MIYLTTSDPRIRPQYQIILTSLAALVILSSCGLNKDPQNIQMPNINIAQSSDKSEISDTTQGGIIQFLNIGSYQAWKTRQTDLVTSNAAHAGKTRTYFNDVAAAGSRTGQNPMPVNSILIKEIFDNEGTVLQGQAVIIKVTSGNASNSWIWFEGFKPSYAGAFYGAGLSTCTSCHSSGRDFVRTSAP